MAASQHRITQSRPHKTTSLLHRPQHFLAQLQIKEHNLLVVKLTILIMAMVQTNHPKSKYAHFLKVPKILCTLDFNFVQTHAGANASATKFYNDS